MNLGIRARLIVLSLGVALPLVTVGLVALLGMRAASEQQLNESLERQAELAAVAFERWINEHVRGLSIVALRMERSPGLAAAREDRAILRARRPHLLDVHVLDPNAAVMLQEPVQPGGVRPAISTLLMAEMRRTGTWMVLADTSGEQQPAAIAVSWPLPDGSAVVARLSSVGVTEVFQNVQLPDGALIAAFDARRRTLYHSMGLPAAAPDTQAALDAVSDRRTAVVEVLTAADGMPRMYAAARAGTTNCVAIVAVPTQRLYKPARDQFRRYVVFSLLALLFAAVAAIAVAQGISRPIRRLREGAVRFGAGDVGARAQVQGGGEVEDLASAFNGMADLIQQREARLNEIDTLKSEFVSSVSHELRTLLTTIKTLTRVLLRGQSDEEERRDYLQVIAAECDRQIDLVVNLLDLTRIESGRLQVTVQPVDAVAVVRECIQAMATRTRERRVTVTVDVPGTLPHVLADFAALRRVVCGLVDNALKYSPEGAAISVSSSVSDERLGIHVSDTGPGIRAGDLPHVFEKFYRGHVEAEAARESAGRTDEPGIGLGLYIARTLVEQMGGQVAVKSDAGRGSTFTVWLRLAPHRPDGAGQKEG